MARYIMLVAAITLPIASVWLLASLINMIRARTRAKDKRNAIISMSVIVASFFTLMIVSILAPPTRNVEVAAIEQPVETAPHKPDEPDKPKEVVPTVTAPVPTAKPKIVAAEPQQPKHELLPTQEARLICQALDQIGLASAPCTYSGWDSTITMTINMSVREARKLCRTMVKYSRDHKMGLSGWRLEIKSPYSGNSSIAFCPLA